MKIKKTWPDGVVSEFDSTAKTWNSFRRQVMHDYLKDKPQVETLFMGHKEIVFTHPSGKKTVFELISGK
jgi:hypothetical protein